MGARRHVSRAHRRDAAQGARRCRALLWAVLRVAGDERQSASGVGAELIGNAAARPMPNLRLCATRVGVGA
jgi:hypothetical protein